jgi:hypothetical protein
MSQRILPSVIGVCIAGCALTALAQDEALGPPEVLQYPLAAAETAPRAVTGPFLRKAIEDAADLGLCEALMTQAGHTFPTGFLPENCTPSFADQVRTQQGFVHWRGANARPLKCGAGCVGRPFLTGTRQVDRPNLRETMIYGHLDFSIDPPGPVNRDLTYFYEVHVQCKASNGARVGNIEVKVEVGDPVIGNPGGIEAFVDFLLLPARISQRIESFIKSQLQPVPDVNTPGDPCRSIGASLATNPLFDSAPFDPVTGPVIRPELGGILTHGDRAKVEFLAITRKPLPGPPLVAPEHAQPGNPAAGYFTVYLNGAVVGFPPPLNMPEGLMLPPEGGTVPVNYCRTVSLDGADRLQLLFVNGLGGAVWSQFSRPAGFGANTPRRITTGRAIVVPGLPGPPDPVTGRSPPTHPQVVVLREFELLYRITYLPAPVITDAGATGGGGRRPPGGAMTGALGDRPVLSDGSAPSTPCREI